MRRLLFTAALFTALAPAALAQAPQTPAASASAAAATFARDRQAILAQTGEFRVRFDMREMVSFLTDYDPLAPKLSGGHEIVRLISDDGRHIRLQHILVMEHGGQTVVVKHWRQDWTYEPDTVLTYAGPDTWRLTPVNADARRGAWSQTVWQTDDSPRYGGVGHWSHDHGLSVWTSDPTWRPLARRDAIRHPVYDRYIGTNRHALTPSGWVHIQDNLKLESGQGDAADDTADLIAVVQEDVVNSYTRSDAFDPGPGDRYWAATATYWAAVRDAWDQVATDRGGITVEEVAESGAVTGPPLMDLADQIADGRITPEAAIPRARALIAAATQ